MFITNHKQYHIKWELSKLDRKHIGSVDICRMHPSLRLTDFDVLDVEKNHPPDMATLRGGEAAQGGPV